VTTDIKCKVLFISIVIPVRNEARSIRTILSQLVAQRYDPGSFEVLVIDGESTDGTAALVAEFADRHDNVRLLHNPRRLSSAARNIGIRHAGGDVVVVVDGHCELEDDRFLSKLASAFERSGAESVGRPQPLDVSEAGPLQRAIAAARASWLGHHPDSFIYSSQARFVPAKSVAVAYRRSVFETIGYFDESFDACEDCDFNHRLDRAGLRCYFEPQVAVRYRPRDSLRGLFRQLVRYGRGRIRLMRKHSEHVEVGALLPAAFVFGLIAGLPLAFFSSSLAVLYAGTLLFYLFVILSGSAMIALRQRNAVLLPWLLLVFLTVHLASGTGALMELAVPGRKRIASREAAAG